MKGIDIKAIQAELDELVNPTQTGPIMTPKAEKVTVKLDKTAARVAIREEDRGGKYGYTITLNPTKIHTPKQLDEQLQWVKERIV